MLHDIDVFFFSIYNNIQPLWHDISNIGPIVISGGFLFAMHQHTTRILILIRRRVQDGAELFFVFIFIFYHAVACCDEFQ